MIQAGGWLWRGVVVWDRPRPVGPRWAGSPAQCEYVVWGTAGPSADREDVGCLGGVIREPVRIESATLRASVEPMTAVIAKAAGLALGEVRDAHVVDAIVMASAMLRGDLKYTVDFDDLMRLRGHFPTVRVFSPTQEPRSSKATLSRKNRRLD